MEHEEISITHHEVLEATGTVVLGLVMGIAVGFMLLYLKLI